MPFLSQTFSHTVESATLESWNYEKTSEEIIICDNDYKFVVEHSKLFYNDLRSLLEQTNLNITFNEDEYSFNIFDMDIIIRCFPTNRYFLPTSTSTDTLNDASQGKIVPYVILPREEYIYGYTATEGNNLYTWRTLFNSEIGYRISKLSIMGGCSSLIESTKNLDTIHPSYGIKIWYNDNYIMCNLISFTNQEVPLFCFVQGTINNGNNTKAVYISINPNIRYYNASNFYYFYHKIAIPVANMDKTKYYTYLPSSNCYYNASVQNGYIFDITYFPSSTVMQNLNENGTMDTNIYIPQKATAFGGIIEFDNMINISYSSVDSIKGTPFTIKNSYYKINNDIYYYPGYTQYYFTEENIAKFMFKI